MAAGDLPLYESRLNPTGNTPSPVQPAPIPSFEGASAGYDAMTKAGEAVTDLSVKMQAARAQTEASDATTRYIVGQDEIEQRYRNDRDFRTAPDRFEADLRQLRLDTLGTIRDPALRQRAELEFTRAGITSTRRVRERAFLQEADANVANLDAQELPNLRSAADAVSPAERQAAIERQFAANRQAAEVGYITQVAREQRDRRFLAALDASDVTKLITTNPRRAGELLDDPKNFPNLSEGQRLQFRQAARSQTDIDGQLRIGVAANYNPAGAAFTSGTLTNPAHARLLFDRGILPAEGSGDTAVSPKGALGQSQLLVGTARDVAKAQGLDDVAALDDDALRQRLLSDKALNYRLGLGYFEQMVRRYGGAVAPAAAAYNAGPGRADAWVQKATAQFGPGFTVAQFASVVDIKETKDYLAKVAKATGGDMNGLGVSPDGLLRAANAVGTRIDGNETDRARVAKEIARADDFNPAGILQAGNEPDPAATATWVQRQTDAAAFGDSEARKKLDDYYFRKAMAPAVKQAYATPPALLDNTIAAEEARQASQPVTQAEVDRLTALKEVRDEVKKRAHAEPVRLLSRAGLTPYVALDPQAAAGDANFAAALSARGAQAVAAQRLYQGSANPLLAEEAAALKERYANAGPDERFRLVRTMAESLPEPALADALAAVTGSADTMVAARIIRDRPQLGRDIMLGAELRKSKEVQQQASLIQPAFAATLGGQVYPDPAMQKAVEAAAINLYVARSAANGTLYEPADTAAVETAIEDVTGKIVKRNGVRTPIAPGIDHGRFIGVLDNLSERDVTSMGGAVDRSGRVVSAGDISQYAVLKPLAPGSPLYVVGMKDAAARDGFSPLFTAGVAEGGFSPLVFNMAELTKGRTETTFLPGEGARRAAAFRGQLSDRYHALKREVESGAQP